MPAAQNTVTRTIDPASPIWMPFLINIGFLAIIGGVALYNHIDTPLLAKTPKV